MALLSDVTGIGNIGLAGIPTTVLGTSTTIDGTIDINAGTIDGTVIGGTTAAAGSFTTFTSTGIDDNASGPAITIDASNNVGIGTSLPASGLELEGVGNATNVTLDNTTGTTGRSYSIRSGNTGNLDFYDNDATTARLVIDSAGDVQLTSAAAVKLGWNRSGAYYNWIESDGVAGNNFMRFGVGNDEKMRIDSDGRCLFGTTDTTLYLNSSAPSGVLINGAGGEMQIASLSTGIYVNRYGSSGTAIDLRSNGGVAGTIYVTTNSASYNTSSDYRLKEDDLPMTGATERVKALRPINFAWKVDGSRTDGFFAHEAQEVVPECSTGTKDAMRDEEYEVTPAVEEVKDEDGNVTTEAVPAVMGTRSVPDYQGIDQSKLVPLLTATIQELIARIEALEGA